MPARPLRAALAALVLLVSLAATGQATAPAADPLADAVRERLDHLRYEMNHEVRGERIVLAETVVRYFESQQFEPRWRDPARLDLLISALADVQDDGLDPRDYHLAALQSFRADLRSASALSAEQRADLELLATDAMMLALEHLYLGKVDPVKLSSQWNFATRPIPADQGFAELTRALDSGQIRETFDRARPQGLWYRRGRERLREYRAIAAAGGWPAIGTGPALKPGMSDSRVPALRRRLQVTHDLDGAAPEPEPPSLLYDAQLEAAVKRFQDRHGLTADGAVGPATRDALSVPVTRRIDQIRVNLERGRWVLHELRGEFVMVDAAGFNVSYFRNDAPIWTSRVIVGRPYRETPIFKSLITYVVFNPTWTVPPTILVKDKLPLLRRDPGYLRRNHIRIIDDASGREVNPATVDWSRYSAGRLPPYQLRQDPGEDNALGLVKIMFPNPYMVYLHDTPTKALFEKDERTFSSGCIRVQRAFELAELVLNDPTRWNATTMAAVVASKRMQTVTLAKPVPVLILYWTALPRADGQMIFRNDVYGRDPPTLAALNSEFRPPPR